MSVSRHFKRNRVQGWRGFAPAIAAGCRAGCGIVRMLAVRTSLRFRHCRPDLVFGRARRRFATP